MAPSTMRAWRLHGVGDLRLDTVDVPSLGDGDALIRVGACSICSSDVPRVYETGTYHYPTIPGHEFAGLVVSVGNDAHWEWVGKRVGVFPLIPCMECPQCGDKRYEMCEKYNYLGSRCDGGFAEYVRAPIWNLIELPDGIGWDEAALLEPAAVALHAARTAIEGRDALSTQAFVSGTGAIGFLCALWFRLLGCGGVVVRGRNDRKRRMAEELSLKFETAADCVNCAVADVAIEAVGSSSSIEACLSVLKPGGKLVLMGNPDGDMRLSKDAYWSILRKQLVVAGSWNSSYESGADCDWSAAVSALSDGRLNVEPLLTHRLPLGSLLDGLDLMRRGDTYGRVVVSGW